MLPTSFLIEDIHPADFPDPVDWFFAEHYRHRQFCHALTESAAAHVFDGEQLTRLVEFLRHDMALHIIDEEEDLFPLLRRRAHPEDEIEGVLGLLSGEHKADGVKAQSVLRLLDDCLARQAAPGLDSSARKAMLELAAQELRHLALENAVVLPIARLRLSSRDFDRLRRRLAARRGVVLEATAS